MLKKLYLTVICIACTAVAKSQSINPIVSTEMCPGQEIIFTVTVPGILPSLSAYAPNSATVPGVIVVGAYDINTSGGNTTFKFKGKFTDNNKNHNFRVNYTNNYNEQVFYDALFYKIKSLDLLTPSAEIDISVPSNKMITATPCVSQNFTISFPMFSSRTKAHLQQVMVQ